MNIFFTASAWIDYLYWQKENPKKTERINVLLKEIQREPFKGIGKPEPLKFQLQNYWSRRIDKEHRLIYRIHEKQVQVISCRYHYS